MPSDDVLSHAGVVQAIEGGQAIIAVPAAGCSGCGKKSSCGVGRLAGGGDTRLVTLPAPTGLKAGQPVTLQVRQAAVNRAALQGYLVPAALLVIGAIAGDLLAAGDAGAVLGAFAGLAGGLAASRLPGIAAGRPAADFSIHFEAR
jgi:sigma-E factor negative regulatory protein RseC